MGPRRSTDCALIEPGRSDTRFGAVVDDHAVNNTQNALNSLAEALTYHEELIATSRDLKAKSDPVALDTEILGDDRLHDLSRSAVNRLDAGVDERA
jgi:hypothetical protein